MSDATCKTCPFWTRETQTKWSGGLADGKEPARYGDCHLASVQSGTEDDFQPYEDWFCSEHPALQRDRLAAMAMQGIAGNWELGGSDPAGRIRGLVKNAYAVADAMLAARGR